MFLNLFMERVLIRSNNLLKTCQRFSSSTIYSLSTNIRPTGSAIAVIRISGNNSSEALRHLIRKKWVINKCIGNPRKAFFTQLYDIKQNEVLDSSIVIFFRQPFSYTGEDMCELHVHGSNAVINSILTALGRIDGFRPATTGEFTKRALINNKMDLIEVEAINDLIKSQTDSQRRRALTAITGTVSRKYDNWRSDIIVLMANVEALIDFGEEELIADSVFKQLKHKLNDLKNQIVRHLDTSKRKSQLIKDGLNVAIIGAPNVGKSTLINGLSERQLSIVSPISGTTRDVVQTWLNISGYSVCLSDTAGITQLADEPHNSIERQGIERAIQMAQKSDLILFVIDSSSLVDNSFDRKHLKPEYLRQILEFNSNIKVFYLFNKIDLISKKDENILQNYLKHTMNELCGWSAISCQTLNGFNEFTKMFTKTVEQLCGNPMTETLFMSARHESHLNKTVRQIELSIECLDDDIAVSAHYLREAAQQISYITGTITTEDVLDVIFKDFCIGK